MCIRDRGYAYAVQTENPFTALQVDAAVGTSEFKLGSFSYGEESLGTPIDLSYDILGFDGDGDAIAGVIDVAFYPSGYTWTGTTGDDTHSGDADHNVLLGDGGNDTLYGLAGDDVLDGNSGNDHLYGGDGDDLIYGGSGNDHLDGGIGSDLLDGGSGDDILAGGDGDDQLIGGLGNDELAGGSGADTFIYSALYNEGQDTITDFNLNEDILSFYDVLDDGDGVLSDAELAAFTDDITVTITGTDITLADANGTSVTLEGANVGATPLDNFSGSLTDFFNDHPDAINIDINPDTFAS